MPTLFSVAGHPRKPEPPVLTSLNQSGSYFPRRGLGYSFLVHTIILIVLLLLPTAYSPKEPRPWERAFTDDPTEGRFVMYLPTLGGGGGQEGGAGEEQGSSDSGPASVPSAGKDGLVYPGPQVIRSDFAVPTNTFQTLLQPELNGMPDLAESADLPNLLSMPEAGNAEPSGPADPDPQPEGPNPPDEPRPEESSVAAETEPLQEEIEELPPRERPAVSTDLLPLPDVRDVESPEVEEPKEPQPEDPPDIVKAEPLEPTIEDLPTPRQRTDLQNLLQAPNIRQVPQSETVEVAVGLADPDEAKDQQPIDPSDGSAIEPLQLQVEDLPTLGRPSTLPDLISTPELEPVPKQIEETAPADPAEVLETESERPPLEPEENEVIEPLAPEPPAQLPSRGTDVPGFLALTLNPVLSEEAAKIPTGEARGRFTIAPEPNLDTSKTEPGLPGEIMSENPTVDPDGKTGDTENLPSMVTISFGPPGEGTGEGTGEGSSGSGSGNTGTGSGTGAGPATGVGSGTGSGTGTGTGSGAGSGPGSGPGDGPFAGITIIGGVGANETAGSGPGSDGNRGTLAGFTIVGGEGTGSGSKDSRPFDGITIAGGVSGAEAFATSVQLPETPRPLETRYGLSLISTESAGGGLPYFGVFSSDQIRTVYIDMRKTPNDDIPFWPLEVGVPTGTDVQTNPAGMPDNSDPSKDQGDQAKQEQEEQKDQKWFLLPAPIVKTPPELPSALVKRYHRKMVIVCAVINVEGKMEQMSVKQSPEPFLNQPVLDALSQWVFRPALLDGAPVPVQTLLGVPLWAPED